MRCPCCDLFVKVYKRKLNARMARGLIWLVAQAGPERNFVYVPGGPTWLIQTNEIATTAHWDLIEARPKDPKDRSRRTSGWWRPTVLGVDFVNDKANVPLRLHFLDNRVVGVDEELTNIVRALGSQFDYPKLMSAGGQ